MPPWLLLVLVVAGFSLVVPLCVLGITGRWRVALTAWRQYAVWLGALALPGALAWIALSIWPPIP